jgi:hypothetical protein
MNNPEVELQIKSCSKTDNPRYVAHPYYVIKKREVLMKNYFCLTVVAVLAISAIAQAGTGSCTAGSFQVSFSSANFVTGLGWSTGTTRTISWAGSCSGCSLGPHVYGWGYGSTLVEYYIGRGGGSSAGSYSTSKGSFTLYTNSCTGPNITGTGPFTQYNASGSGTSGQPMGEHFNGWSSLGKGLSTQNYQVVAVEGWSGNTGSATVSVAGSSWYTNWVGSGTATFTCGGGGTLPGQAGSPTPANGATGVGITTDLSWTAGSGATSHDVYFGTASSPPLVSSSQTGTTYDTGTMANNTRYYWRIDEKNAGGTTTGDLWSFTTIVATPGKATSPSPSNGATGVGITTDLSWTAGSGATSHDVYFGTASTPPLVSSSQTGTTYDTGTMANNTRYYWRIDEKNAGGTTTGDLWSFTTITAATGTGVILGEWWTGISGTAVSDLTSDVNYPDNSTVRELLIKLAGPTNWADNYGTRIRGYVIPPADGNYIFSIDSNDDSELWLSTDDSQANAVLIASKPSNPQSTTKSLVAGRNYYIEVLHKAGVGSDNLSVSWQGPGISQQVIDGLYLSPCCLEFRDFANLAAEWNSSDCNSSNNWCSGNDINRDGSVLLNDLKIFTDWWLNGL